MRQPIIAVASLLAGFAVMALVVSLQQDPLEWTRAGTPLPPTSHATAPSMRERPKEPPPSEPSIGIVTLPAVQITAARPATRPEKKLEGTVLEPCSEWREIGPAYVEQGKPRGTRRVRNLC
jgi:hypothetical protein